ncbi:uncharacterized protein CIMG_03097 [Coccidioides immitis RS]|uniref:Orotidine 5'-phosphate decarboxylase domain-containing protein n=3 Tax=Coccidioides immitis TaxID=5501 RepID=J3KAL6_COCIM|nr:uncharacterized protein CIMG_03097 [Coccidioides immitis RS]EAS32073.3 hypothetical protein CIMG_03097 [Coccidioides immitis RS]KMP07265.1 hypothetical protein CIRG_06946 [Coccidioides immitis RMSCC 2394]KMU80971.1 hypothetical protein CISG_08913 [Coccidioides immitis RMSCC 3703]
MDDHMSPSSRNPLTTYLRQLRQTKTSLPHGELVCVSASPNISTVAALLRLACAVGPYIAVLQVHADIIDDWSPEAVRRLTNVAKRFSFLIWEGGRILNTKRRPTGQHALSSHEIARDVAMARKRYTKGINVAAWAGLASTWVIGSEGQDKGGCQLIPTLRRAARETVSRMTTSVRTEISGGQSPSIDGTDDDDCGDSPCDNEEQDQNTLNTALEDLDISPPLRKSSVISLTRTITQHEEPSRPPLIEVDDDCDCGEINSENESALAVTVTPPPLLSRGILIYLPSNGDTQSKSLHRQAAIISGKTHNDFVVGFVTEEPWTNVRRDQALAESLRRACSDEQDDLDEDDDEEGGDGNGKDEGNLNNMETYAIFSPLENDHVGCSTNVHEPRTSAGESLSSQGQHSSSRHKSGLGTQAQQIRALHQLVAQALSLLSTMSPAAPLSSSDAKQGCSDILYIPVITMNL